ncbi:MAG TPA: PKD domain-containing protein [Bacteroidia bacterium]|jgi:subtilisin-like proprotein convertase family protein
MKKLLLSLLVFSSVILRSQTFTSTTGGSIPDNNTEVCFPLAVIGLPAVIDTLFGVSQVCVNLNHTWDGDLKIMLKAPDGTYVMLSNNNGGSGDNYTNSCFAMNGINGQVGLAGAPFTGTFIPNGNINAVNNNQNPNGTWYICVIDEVPQDFGNMISCSITFGPNPPQGGGGGSTSGPCSTTNGAACVCPDGTSNCDLLPDMTASSLIIQNQHTEYPGLLTLSNATPNIGWGPMEIHGSNSCWCDTVSVPCSTSICPDGSYPTQKLKQTIYHKSGSTISSYDILTSGVMSYHPTHGHVHVDNWAEFTLRSATSNPDATTWPIIAAGSKISFCLINLGDCTSDYGYCRDGNYGPIMTMADIPNSPFGMISGCGNDQGIYVGNLDIYSEGLPGMSIDLTGVCNGNYYIVSVTDPDNNFLESDETNNWSATPITLTQQTGGPVASFTYSGGPNVQFYNSASITYGYQWYFGDGGTSSNQNPQHMYTSNGVYNVTLIVSSPCGNDTTTQLINVTSVGIEASAQNLLGYSVYPNPVTPNTTVSYFLKDAGNVGFSLYNSIGQEVYSVNKGFQAAGHYEFNLDLGSANIENGVYLLQLKTGTQKAGIRILQLNN